MTLQEMLARIAMLRKAPPPPSANSGRMDLEGGMGSAGFPKLSPSPFTTRVDLEGGAGSRAFAPRPAIGIAPLDAAPVLPHPNILPPGLPAVVPPADDYLIPRQPLAHNTQPTNIEQAIRNMIETLHGKGTAKKGK